MMATSYLNSTVLYSADQGIGKSRDAKKVLIGKNVVMIVVFEQIDDNSEKSQVCVGHCSLVKLLTKTSLWKTSSFSFRFFFRS